MAPSILLQAATWVIGHAIRLETLAPLGTSWTPAKDIGCVLEWDMVAALEISPVAAAKNILVSSLATSMSSSSLCLKAVVTATMSAILWSVLTQRAHPPSQSLQDVRLLDLPASAGRPSDLRAQFRALSTGPRSTWNPESPPPSNKVGKLANSQP
jgi:hypothetical protein